jgi:UPF0755 protein
MKRILIVCGALLVAAAFALNWWIEQPLTIPTAGVKFKITQGSSVAKITRDLEDTGLIPNARLATVAARYWGVGTKLQAGDYQIVGPHTLRSLLESLTDGKTKQLKFTIVEGWNIRELIEALNESTDFKTEPPLTVAALSQALQIPAAQFAQFEGQFFPDTYFLSEGGERAAVLKRAKTKMETELETAWNNKAADLPYKDKNELLIMASIIEKETNDPKDRTKVASVFVNRQRIGMRLQTDPTVIYGLGEKFDGNLTRAHLQADTPYNSYTRAGFPPTPIAMPGRAALEAAANPVTSKLIYFVARGDGSSEFSETLDAHNRAVAKYQLRK